LTDVSARKFFD